MIELSKIEIEKFWSKVDKQDGCWMWLGQKDRGGYGKVYSKGKNFIAHRVAYYLTNGHIGKLHACHKCDNPGCVRPDHIFLGTNADNVRDRHSKGRTKHKVSWDIVNSIRVDYLSGMKTKDIDDKYQYRSTHGICSNRVWFDPNYNPEDRIGHGRGPESKKITIYGETKDAQEWSKDTRCEICLSEIRRRIRNGHPINEKLIKRKITGHKKWILENKENQRIEFIKKQLDNDCPVYYLNDRLRVNGHSMMKNKTLNRILDSLGVTSRIK